LGFGVEFCIAVVIVKLIHRYSKKQKNLVQENNLL